MQVNQVTVRSISALPAALAATPGCAEAQLALVFGAPALLGDERLMPVLRAALPSAQLAGCSTAGEISRDGLADESLVVTTLHFAAVRTGLAVTELADMDDSAAAGARLGEQLCDAALKAVVVFGQGVRINGSALIEGLRQHIAGEVPITGGLAGDGTRFGRTLVLTPGGVSASSLVAVGLFGEALRFGHGSFGGWEPFGTLRKVTRCRGNVLYELDGRPALDIYKEYLGEHARDLPASGLLFPFEMIDRARAKTSVIRTILAVDNSAGSMTLAGDIDPDGYLQLMHASTDRLIDGAAAAASAAQAMQAHPQPGLALLVSCVGRKLVMGDRIDEEIEAVGEVFGRSAVLAGFYSYGEISPYAPGAECRLHNQTMTVTWIAEDA